MSILFRLNTWLLLLLLLLFLFYRNYPVLLQGPTSAGKTSCIQYLARVLGQECLRINNHEHTDLQEYVGSYTTSASGQLIFQEGTIPYSGVHLGINFRGVRLSSR